MVIGVVVFVVDNMFAVIMLNNIVGATCFVATCRLRPVVVAAVVEERCFFDCICG